jgi:hypothetical protein
MYRRRTAKGLRPGRLGNNPLGSEAKPTTLLRERARAPERKRARNKNIKMFGHVHVYEHEHVHVISSKVRPQVTFASLP